jgi:hypothetical protein
MPPLPLDLQAADEMQVEVRRGWKPQKMGLISRMQGGGWGRQGCFG